MNDNNINDTRACEAAAAAAAATSAAAAAADQQPIVAEPSSEMLSRILFELLFRCIRRTGFRLRAR